MRILRARAQGGAVQGAEAQGRLVGYWRVKGWPEQCHPTTGDDQGPRCAGNDHFLPCIDAAKHHSPRLALFGFPLFLVVIVVHTKAGQPREPYNMGEMFGAVPAF